MEKISGLSVFQKKLLKQLGVALGIIVVLGISIFMLGKSISVDATETERLRLEKVNWSSSVQSYVSAKTQYTKKGKDYEQILENILPERDSLIDLKKDFQFLAAGEGLDLNFSFSTERDKGSKLVGAIGITLTVQGSSERKIFSFLEKLEGFRYLFSIDAMSLQREKDRESGAERVTAVIRGEVLYRNL